MRWSITIVVLVQVAASFGSASDQPAGQLVFSPHLIDDHSPFNASVHACDLDGDGELEIVGAAMADDSIQYWKRDGDNPDSWVKHVISSQFYGANSVYASDLDSDGDLDVIGAANDAGEVAWWRNGGGSPVAWTEQILIEGWYWAGATHAADLDGDADLDITATSRSPGEVLWWRNDGGSPVSWFQQRIATIPGAWPLTIVDLDGDGDNDVVAAGRHEVRWYRNEGRMIRVRPSGGRVRP